MKRKSLVSSLITGLVFLVGCVSDKTIEKVIENAEWVTEDSETATIPDPGFAEKLATFREVAESTEPWKRHIKWKVYLIDEHYYGAGPEDLKLEFIATEIEMPASKILLVGQSYLKWRKTNVLTSEKSKVIINANGTFSIESGDSPQEADDQ